MWAGVADSITHVRTGESCVYEFLNDDGDRKFLRLTHPEHRDRATIEAEIDFLQHLQRTDVVAVRPVPSKQGSYVESQRVADLTFHSVAMPNNF